MGAKKPWKKKQTPKIRKTQVSKTSNKVNYNAEFDKIPERDLELPELTMVGEENERVEMGIPLALD